MGKEELKSNRALTFIVSRFVVLFFTEVLCNLQGGKELLSFSRRQITRQKGHFDGNPSNTHSAVRAVGEDILDINLKNRR